MASVSVIVFMVLCKLLPLDKERVPSLFPDGDDGPRRRLLVNVDLGPRPGAASTASVADVVLLLQLRLTPSAGAGVS